MNALSGPEDPLQASCSLNAITDVSGVLVLVGHETLLTGPGIQTSVAATLPHTANLFEDRTPARVIIGKFIGLGQANIPTQQARRHPLFPERKTLLSSSILPPGVIAC